MKGLECHKEIPLEVVGHCERIYDRSNEAIEDSLKDHWLTVGDSWEDGVLERDMGDEGLEPETDG